MHFFEKAADVVQNLVGEASETVKGSRTFDLYLSSHLAIPCLVTGTNAHRGELEASFTKLAPGQAGAVRFEGEGGFGGAVELDLGAERLLLGAYCSAKLGKCSFSLEFVTNAGRTPEQFYRSLPSHFMGEDGEEACATGTTVAAYVEHAACARDCVAHVILAPRAEITPLPGRPGQASLSGSCAFAGVGSECLLHFVEWCRARGASAEAATMALFLGELAAAQQGLADLSFADRAFTLDLLVCGFVGSGALGEPLRTALEPELLAWQRRVPEALGHQAAESYWAYQSPPGSPKALAAYVDAAQLLLKAAAARCSTTLATLAAACKEDGSWGAGTAEADDVRSSPSGHRRVSVESEVVNSEMLVRHLARGNEGREATVWPASPAGAKSADADAALAAHVQRCIHASADFAARCAAAFAAVVAELRSERARAALRRYREQVPGARRSFAIGCDSWGAEVFAGLDGGAAASPEQMLVSLGRKAPPYKSMATNSKSGEFFFFSKDRRFLVKTITEDEALLLFRMLPAYGAHMAANDGSLIVRYAGLYRAQVPGVGVKYFSVMASVFDPRCEIHETFDLKGSLHHRRKKRDDKIGKDQDWVDAGQRLQLPDGARREFCAAHETDAAFLRAFGVMDYSLLVGIHHAKGNEQSDSLARGALRAQGSSDVYFVGLIDFLISFSLRKQGEHLVRVFQGHGHDTSCVHPDDYATRQVHFVRERVVSPPSKPSDASGTCGTLRVTFIAGHDLVNADGPLNKSDPYACAELGLQRFCTQAIQNDLNPRWGCTLSLAVDKAHLEQDVRLSVWDEDHVRAVEGGDDLLGRLRVPLGSVMAKGRLELREKLQEARHGELSVRLEYVPGGSAA